MKARKLILVPIAAVLLLALPASASAATFMVNETGDQADASTADGVCDRDTDMDGKQCTLRAAIDQANVSAASRDTVNFGAAVVGNTIFPVNNFNVDTPMKIDAGDCGDQAIAHKPCVRVDNPSSNAIAFIVNGPGADDVLIRGLAVTGVASFPAIQVDAGANRFQLRNSWIGMDLDQNSDPNVTGVELGGNDATIGGTSGADRNVFAYNDLGLDIAGGDRAKVRGNYFGVKADGTTPAPGSTGTQIKVQADPSTDTVIGASIDSSHRATTKCDGGCNVIASATSEGIENAGQGTTIKGNFIGLDATGMTAQENQLGIIVSGADTTIGGATSAERNFITGGSVGIQSFANNDVEIKRNYIGLNSAGTAVETAPSFAGANIISPATGGTLVSRNRIAGDSVFGLTVDGTEARIVRNKIGLDKNGNDEDGPGTGFRVTAGDSTIGEPGAGNTVGNTNDVAISVEGLAAAGSGDNNILQGNYIGTDSGGAAHPNAGVGIRLLNSGGDASFNKIGGTSGASENVISNSGDDAIQLMDPTDTSNGNQFKRNRGKDNGSGGTGCNGGPCDLFIDLIGDDGIGNVSALQGAVEAPTPSGANRTSIDGINGDTGATVYIFRTSDPGGAAPTRVNAFVDTAVVNGLGEWEATFPQIPAGQNLTVLQITPSPNLNGSELSEVCEVAGEDC